MVRHSEQLQGHEILDVGEGVSASLNKEQMNNIYSHISFPLISCQDSSYLLTHSSTKKYTLFFSLEIYHRKKRRKLHHCNRR